MTTAPTPLRGRETEIETVRRVAAGPGPHDLLIVGEPGIGKSSLWAHGVAVARATGTLVLATTCAAPEADLPYAALTELVGPLVEPHGRELPAPQRRALDQVLMLADGPVDPRALAAGVHRLLQATGPLLLAVDDLQWLDPETERVLRYALRRLHEHGPRLLLASRHPSPLAAGPPTAPCGPPFGADLPVLRLGPLAARDARTVLGDRLGLRVCPVVVEELVERTGGNPFWLLEFARLGIGPLERRVPESLSELGRTWTARLDPTTTLAACWVAALGRPTVAAVRRALDVPDAEVERALDAAVAANLVTVAGDRLVPSHPLVGAALLAALPPFRRRRLHEEAAGLAGCPEQTAHHLLQADAVVEAVDADGGDRRRLRLLSALDEASASTAHRGAPALAARYADRALREVPADDPGLPDRLIRAAELHHRVGSFTDAHRLLDRIDLDALPDDRYERAALLLSDAVLRRTGAPAARALLVALEDRARAAGHAAGSRRLTALDTIAADRLLGRPDRLLLAERAAVAAGRNGASPDLRRHALARLASARADAAVPMGDALVRLHELDRLPGATGVVDNVAVLDGTELVTTGRPAEAWTVFDRAVRQLADMGGGPGMAGLRRAYTEFLLGRTDAAEATVALLTVDDEAWLPGTVAAFSLRALVHLARGDLEAVETLLAQSDDPPEPYRSHVHAGRLHVRGALALERGHPDQAVPLLRGYLDAADGAGVTDPLWRYDADVDLAEAHVAVGDPDAAEGLADHLAAVAGRTSRAVTAGQERRLRAQIAAARGDLDAGLELAARAVAIHEAGPQPAELARSLAALADVQRRTGRGVAARAATDRARRLYLEIGHRWHAARLRTDGRPGSPAPLALLSDAERDVALLVVTGMTNRKAAQKLSLSVRTVENHLSRMYRKLGIGSRDELRTVLTEPDEA